MNRKAPCPVKLTRYDAYRIIDMWNEYKSRRTVEGVACSDMYDAYRQINVVLNTDKSERTLRRIYNGEFPVSMFPVTLDPRISA